MLHHLVSFKWLISFIRPISSLMLASAIALGPNFAAAEDAVVTPSDERNSLRQMTIDQIQQGHDPGSSTVESDAKQALEGTRARMGENAERGIGIVAQDEIRLGEGEMSTLFKESAQTFRSISEDIPAEELAKARCIVIFPDINTGGIIAFGAASGKGVATCRNDAGDWSQFGFVNLSSEKLGLQLGKKSTKAVVLVYSPEGESELQRGAYELNATASFVTSDQESLSRAGTRDVAVFTKERGLFVGAGLGVTRIKEDPSMMEAFYREPVTLTRSLTSFEYDRSEFPDYTNDLIIVLPPKVDL